MRRRSCVGVDEANEWIAEWLDSFEDWSLDIEEVVDAGDQVVTIARQHGKAKHGGPKVEMHVAQLWTFRDGLVSRMELYADRDDALEAAGLDEWARQVHQTPLAAGQPHVKGASASPMETGAVLLERLAAQNAQKSLNARPSAYR
jgi:SnoaL-like domain